jgi:general secretion pathway protein J
MRRAADQRGFTLLELVIALAIVGALLVVAFGGMRVALAAWTQGEARAEVHQHLRGVALILGRALGGTYPYRAPVGVAPDPVLLFRGADARLEFVTQTPPFPFQIPVAFAAVVLSVESDDQGPALVVRQRSLPNREPFAEAEVFLRDAAVQRIQLSYLNASGQWADAWDPETEDALPRAVRITVSTVRGERVDELPPLTVALRTGGS